MKREITEDETFRLCHSPSLPGLSGRMVPNPHYIGPYVPPRPYSEEVHVKPLSRSHRTSKLYQLTGSHDEDYPDQNSRPGINKEPSTSSFVPVVTLDITDSECSSPQKSTLASTPCRRSKRCTPVVSTKSLRFADVVQEKEISVLDEPVHIALRRQLTTEREEKDAAKRCRCVKSNLKKVWRFIY
ncbi:hypothetical protein PM082_009446 [Marasmius tenuissimus]|nr:hypothetical protein PM082_009446 [Marasmius tenuissimus]